MGRKRTPGLVKRGEVWHIDKTIRGQRICESTGTSSLEAAEELLRSRIEQIRKPAQRPQRTFEQAAAKYLIENQHKASIISESFHLEDLIPFIGTLPLRQVHDGTLAQFVQHRQTQGRKTKTINLALGVVRKILNLAARSWRDELGETWIPAAPMITMVKPAKGFSDASKPYPLDWDEQDALIKELAPHLAKMALYGANTGCREAEICGLLWEYEWQTLAPELKGRVFIIPGDRQLTDRSAVKGRADRVIVLNDIAKSVVDSQRGVHPTHVFAYRGKPMTRMNNTGWRKAWERAGLPTSSRYLQGVHNLRHTVGRRLRAAGVTNETRKVILGHKNGDVTSHYSATEIGELLEAVNRLCDVKSRKSPALNVVRLKAVS